MKIQWYPGHMTKARRAMQEDIKLVDLVIELLDARCPSSSRNPDIDTLAKGKFRLILLNKTDLADENATKAWTAYYEGIGIRTIPLDSRNTGSVRRLKAAVQEVAAEKIERDRRRGILNRPVRAMVAGIPNVGKSTFINSFAGKSAAKTGNKPGVTKGNQWIRLDKNVELLDTPGILWPKFDDETVGTNLALIGSVNDVIVDKTLLAWEFLRIAAADFPQLLMDRYDIAAPLLLQGNPSPDAEPENPGEKASLAAEYGNSLDAEAVTKLMEAIALSRSCVKKGNEPDLDRIGALILDDFRSGRLGRITLEEP